MRSWVVAKLRNWLARQTGKGDPIAQDDPRLLKYLEKANELFTSLVQPPVSFMEIAPDTQTNYDEQVIREELLELLEEKGWGQRKTAVEMNSLLSFIQEHCKTTSAAFEFLRGGELGRKIDEMGQRITTDEIFLMLEGKGFKKEEAREHYRVIRRDLKKGKLRTREDVMGYIQGLVVGP